MNHIRKSERGQALIFIILGFVVLLGFVALAIDGGMVYSDRRNAQNAVDSSSLAAAGAVGNKLENNGITWRKWTCSGSTTTSIALNNAIKEGKKAAISRAQTNGFSIDTDSSDGNGVTSECLSKTSNAGIFKDNYIEITSQISTTTQASFSQFLYDGPLNNQVEASTRIRPRMPLAYGHAIVSLNDKDCVGNQNGVQIGGSQTTKITGGGIFSNGCLGGDGNKYAANIIDGSISYVSDLAGNTGGMSPGPNKVPEKMPAEMVSVPAPNCNDPKAYKHTSLTGSTSLEPGLHCVTGSGNAIKITNGTFYGRDVTIYVTQGDIEIGGGVETTLLSPARNPDPSPAVGGLLIYKAGPGVIKLTGSATSQYLGLIYAPEATVSIEGANGTNPTFNTQIIAYNVFIAGNASLDINYNDNYTYTKPPSMELAK